MSNRFIVSTTHLSGIAVIVDNRYSENNWVVSFGQPGAHVLAKAVCQKMNDSILAVQAAENHPAGAAQGLYDLARRFAEQERADG